MLPPCVEQLDTETWKLHVKVVPGAKKSSFGEIVEDYIRVRIAAPAVENKANIALLRFIADKLQIRSSQLHIKHGETGRNKLIIIKSKKALDWGCLSF